MKKNCLKSIGVLILLSIVTPALTAVNVSLVSDKGRVQRGDSLTVDIRVDQADGIAGCNFTLIYPGDVLELKNTPITTTFFPQVWDLMPGVSISKTEPWKKNGGISGSLVLSGAYVDLDGDTGGGGNNTGEKTLFSIHFTVKSGAVPGAYGFELKQTMLCNGPAGWGTDVNNDGTYDPEDGDRCEGAPILVKAYPKNSSQWGTASLGDDFTELLSDFSSNPEQDFTIEAAAPPELQLNRTDFNFGVVRDTNSSTSQELIISNTGGGTLSWSAGADEGWLQLDSTAGTGGDVVGISIDAAGLVPDTYTGTITVSAPGVAGSPQTVTVNLTVYNTNTTSPPFGDFATPVDGSTVMSSIAVTGWVLDDIDVQHVKIYRGNTGNLVYIGDAMFVEGARPDVEQAFQNYPEGSNAGWGYMMLTHFLPNGGNGTFQIHAIATDAEGHQITLGTKTITCDNANAVKPFGAIDTPEQGGTASGSKYINWGWVLTPQPNRIPVDGSTIDVYVDGVRIGHPTYNLPREDIAKFFPGYANSDAAAAYFTLDTTAYENGIHTIQWTAADSGKNIDGIGSRFFTIRNSGNSRALAGVQTNSRRRQPDRVFVDRIKDVPGDGSGPLMVKKGQGRENQDNRYKVFSSDANGVYRVTGKELERIVIDFPQKKYTVEGYMKVGSRFRPLPPGSTLDNTARRFYWQPGPGFVGFYRFVFIEVDNREPISKTTVIINIEPKHPPFEDNR